TVLSSNVEYGNATPDLLAAIRREQPDLVFVPGAARGAEPGADGPQPVRVLRAPLRSAAPGPG
ncbi:endonuclease/exonuclease/phosphatase family protein, partial [Streptomyces sp. NPDC051098]